MPLELLLEGPVGAPPMPLPEAPVETPVVPIIPVVLALDDAEELLGPGPPAPLLLLELLLEDPAGAPPMPLLAALVEEPAAPDVLEALPELWEEELVPPPVPPALPRVVSSQPPGSAQLAGLTTVAEAQAPVSVQVCSGSQTTPMQARCMTMGRTRGVWGMKPSWRRA
jgi:hypothetical protein